MEVLKIKQFDVLGEIETNVALREIETNIKGGIQKTFYTIIEVPTVFVYRESQVDKELCASMGYRVDETYYNGGTIVGNAGDVTIANFGTLNNGWWRRWINYLLDHLKAKGLNAEYDGNDVLVDGFKVCGICVTRYGRIDFTACFVSLNTNLDHIKAICKKPMVKVPKGLSDYGITSEEVEQMFLDFCKREDRDRWTGNIS